MTNMERMALESVNTHAITDNKPKKGIAAAEGVMAASGTGVTFADSLKSFTAQTVAAWTPEGKQNTAPDSWQYYGVADESGFNNAILGQVREVSSYLKKIGVDPESRVPAHEITDEQREWLSSRHDFEDLKTKKLNTPEFGDLIADLYYLNVISEDEALSVSRVAVIPYGEVVYSSDDKTVMLIKHSENEAEDERADTALKYLEKMIELERKRLEEKREDYYIDFIHGETESDILDNLISVYDTIAELLM